VKLDGAEEYDNFEAQASGVVEYVAILLENKA